MGERESVAGLRGVLLDPLVPIPQRIGALFSLRNIPTRSAVSALETAMEDSSALLAHEAAFALGQTGDPSAIPALTRVLEDETKHAVVRHEAAEALGNLGGPSSLTLLRRFLVDPAPEVRETCMLAVHRLECALPAASKQSPGDQASSQDPAASAGPTANGFHEEDGAGVPTGSHFAGAEAEALRHKSRECGGAHVGKESCDYGGVGAVRSEEEEERGKEGDGQGGGRAEDEGEEQDDGQGHGLVKGEGEEGEGEAGEQHQGQEQTQGLQGERFVGVDPAVCSHGQASLPSSVLRAVLVDEGALLWERYGALFVLRDRAAGGVCPQAAGAVVDGLRTCTSALLQHEIAYVLGQLQHPASVPALSAVLADASVHAMVRHEAAVALGAVAGCDPECRKLLSGLLQHPEPLVAESCAVALSMMEGTL